MRFHPVKRKILPRQTTTAASHLADLPALLQRVYAHRSVRSAAELDRSLARLPAPALLSGMERMTDRLAEAIQHQQHVMVIADYDADGATACAVAVRGLRALGLERVSFLVPDRFRFGYGLTPEIVALAVEQRPDWLLTVDNGISSLDGAAACRKAGIGLLVTDHHLPGPALPDADAIVNPNLDGDGFPSKSLAGVGVMFYVLLALRQKLRASGGFHQRPEPNLAQLLDLVALGTVADVVPLDHVNRILVHQGLQRMRSGQAHPGVLALLQVAGRRFSQANAADLGFFAGPRLNAAGRLEDMRLGIECLLSDSPDAAREMATELQRLNQERREIEEQMKQDAWAALEALENPGADKPAVCLFDESWHQGVIGILASRIKDRLHRPVIAFAPGNGDEIKGSGRSIPGLHIRDALCDVAARRPGLLVKFGGHAMAAGMSIRRADFEAFAALFEEEVARRLAGVDLDNAIHSDGALTESDLRLDLAEALQAAGPWGQAFPEPIFDGEFDVAECRIVGERHLKLLLRALPSGRPIDAIVFGVDNPGQWLGSRRIRAAYRLDVNEYQGERRLQLRVEYMEAATN